MPERKIERGTPLTCERCGAEFRSKNRNGVPKRFCSVACKDRHRNAQRLKGAAALKEKALPKVKGPSRHAQRVSRQVFQALVPVEQRAELIKQACANLGITDSAQIEAALTRNGCAPCEVSA